MYSCTIQDCVLTDSYLFFSPSLSLTHTHSHTHTHTYIVTKCTKLITASTDLSWLQPWTFPACACKNDTSSSLTNFTLGFLFTLLSTCSDHCIVLFGKIRKSRNDNTIRSMARTKQRKTCWLMHTRVCIHYNNGHIYKLIVWFVH